VANEGILKHAMVTALIGMVVNVVLNLLLIPRFGGFGCVAASLVSFSLSTILLEAFHPIARINLRVMGAALGVAKLPA
jgi:peptidoglycan biosynthesis protein MviN/MurJ (putative lipid II flippase)